MQHRLIDPRAGQHETVLLAAFALKNSEVLARLVARLDNETGNILARDKTLQQRARRAAGQIDGKRIGAQTAQHAGDIDAAAAGIAAHIGAAYLAGRLDRIGRRREIDGRVHGEGNDLGRHDISCAGHQAIIRWKE